MKRWYGAIDGCTCKVAGVNGLSEPVAFHVVGCKVHGAAAHDAAVTYADMVTAAMADLETGEAWWYDEATSTVRDENRLPVAFVYDRDSGPALASASRVRALLARALEAMTWLHENGDTSKVIESRDEITMYFREERGKPDMSADELDPPRRGRCDMSRDDE